MFCTHYLYSKNTMFKFLENCIACKPPDSGKPPVLPDSVYQMSRSMTKPTKWPVCPAKTRISLDLSPVWSESSLCTQSMAKNPRFFHADIEDWSDWADAQADLSRCWAHRSFCYFFHAVAQMYVWPRVFIFQLSCAVLPSFLWASEEWFLCHRGGKQDANRLNIVLYIFRRSLWNKRKISPMCLFNLWIAISQSDKFQRRIGES